jgi:hypothetical protein
LHVYGVVEVSQFTPSNLHSFSSSHVHALCIILLPSLLNVTITHYDRIWLIWPFP